ncbi:dihydrolipoyl dehydrogenase [Fluviibacterium sp. DFM31]|uniref:Dihydrolipoyl dehydrogenase n=1 Tax=Meridianimarinicoccus marinus TaxID=3231483 RepID=A0ABV3L7C5_9RHOB
MRQDSCKLLILGAGPGGYVCGIRAGQLGVDTIVVEAAKPGGTCLNVGCIPSKALIHAADEFHAVRSLVGGNALGISASAPSIDLSRTMAWKDGIVRRLTGGVSGLLKKAGTRYVQGYARVLDGKSVEVTTPEGPLRIDAENIVIATGARPFELPFLPFGGPVISSTEALALPELPKRLSVVGAGYIGLEIGTAMAKLGVRVTLVEAAKSILPQYDAELSKPVLARLQALDVGLHLDAKAQGLTEDGTALRVETLGGPQEIPSDKILVTVGRAPVTTGFGLEDLGLSMTGPYIAVDRFCATSMRGVFAIGDVTGEPMLAHRAMAQGVVVAEHLAGLPTLWDKRAIPAVCFTDPEIVTVGALPGAQEGLAVTTFPLAGNGRSMTLGRSDGFVRIVHDPDSGLIAGIQAVGAGIAEMAGEFSLAIEMGATLTDIAATIHAHPTLGETTQEAALKGLGQALHI